MLRRDPDSDLESEIANRQVSTRRHVSVGNPVRVGDPAVSTRQERSFDPSGFIDETWVDLATCCSCNAVLREESLGGACITCRQVLCSACSGRRCVSCGASVCLRHSVNLGGRIQCRRDFALRLFSWLVLLAGVAIAALLVMHHFGWGGDPIQQIQEWFRSVLDQANVSSTGSRECCNRFTDLGHVGMLIRAHAS